MKGRQQPFEGRGETQEAGVGRRQCAVGKTKNKTGKPNPLLNYFTGNGVLAFPTFHTSSTTPHFTPRNGGSGRVLIYREEAEAESNLQEGI